MMERKTFKNVWDALEDNPDAVANLKLRSELMSRVRIVAKGHTQQEAAKMLGITQPRLNQLLKGKINLFSIDALVNMLARAGLHVKVTIKKAA